MVSILPLYTGIREYPSSSKISFILSNGVPSSIAVMFTRGIRMSTTSRSSNSMTERISFVSSCFSVPPTCASSTIVMISSSVTMESFFSLNIFASSHLYPEKMIFTGYSSTLKNIRTGYPAMANFSGYTFAIIFGVISPTISTAIVVITVDTVADVAWFAIRNPNNMPESVEVVMLTILFPTRIVESRLSYFSARASVFPARLLPFALIVLSLSLLEQE